MSGYAITNYLDSKEVTKQLDNLIKSPIYSIDPVELKKYEDEYYGKKCVKSHEMIEEAKKIKNLSVLFQPIESKSIWENCAKVLASKDDEKLSFYLLDLFKWLQDLNWPGADIIYERLLKMPKQHIETAHRISLSIAENSKDMVWEKALLDFYKDLGDM